MNISRLTAAVKILTKQRDSDKANHISRFPLWITL